MRWNHFKFHFYSSIFPFNVYEKLFHYKYNFFYLRSFFLSQKVISIGAVFTVADQDWTAVRSVFTDRNQTASDERWKFVTISRCIYWDFML